MSLSSTQHVIQQTVEIERKQSNLNSIHQTPSNKFLCHDAKSLPCVPSHKKAHTVVTKSIPEIDSANIERLG